jgi:hypothetical protein
VNGANLTGATNSTLVLSGLTVGQSGNNYSVGVTNVVGGVLSSNATLTVLPVAMVNEWSFNTDGSDSIGGVFCNVAGSATISGGSLVLPGGSQHVNYGDISGIATTTLTNSIMFRPAPPNSPCKTAARVFRRCRSMTLRTRARWALMFPVRNLPAGSLATSTMSPFRSTQAST